MKKLLVNLAALYAVKGKNCYTTTTLVSNRIYYLYCFDFRDVETSAASVPRDSPPHVNDSPSQTSAATGSSPVNNNTTEATAAASGAQEAEATDDFFDPRGPLSGVYTVLCWSVFYNQYFCNSSSLFLVLKSSYTFELNWFLSNYYSLDRLSFIGEGTGLYFNCCVESLEYISHR